MVSVETQDAVNAALQLNDLDRAGQISETALGNGEEHEMLYLFAGVRRQQNGDNRGAVALLDKAWQLDPGNPSILTTLADALRHTGQLHEARQRFEMTLSIDGTQLAALYGLAATLDAMGLLDAALANFARVAEVAPDAAAGHAGMASTLAQLGRRSEARAAAARALALAPTDPASLIALARCEIEEKQLDTAIGHLEQLSERPDLLAHDHVVTLSLLGDALDTQGSTDRAFDAYAAANNRFAEIHAGPSSPPVHAQLVESVGAAVATADLAGFDAPVPAVQGAAANHIFLLGYPRSGNTLVEQILASAPGVETLEERPTLAAAADRYLSAAGIAALGSMIGEEATTLRAAYWQSVRDAGVEPAGLTFVDMDPLKSLHLPLIARLFPEARVIVMRRDPRDVIWSCFRRMFVFSTATYEFSSLTRAANHYDAMMRLTEHCLTRLPLQFHTMRYGDLVRDFDGETRKLCAFAGLPWSGSMRHFDRTARARQVSTRSAAQVRRGLFDGTGQWRRYARQLEPVLPILEPWVRKFGYST